MAKDAIFSIADLRGGVNNSDSPTLLADNQVVDARNIDYRDGALGSKRNGTEGLDLTSAAFDSPVIALFRHTPTNAIGNDELWGIDANGNIDRRVGGTWQGGVTRSNDFVVVNAANYDANAVSLHGKLFIAAQGSEDRLLVWDGTVLRWAGIAQPSSPSLADTAVAGTYAETRYIRIRYTEQVAGVTVRRSEPSATVSIAPAGTFDGITITKPAGTEATTAVTMEGQTHWEVEASIDNILFYRIATVAIGTASYTDNTAYETGYSSNTLSEAAGEYVPPGSARHVAVDEDRIVMAGSFFTAGYGATVWWTPVGADDGVGNDERIPTATRQFITFDGLDGGEVRCLAPGSSGNVYVFKRTRVYKMIRTGIQTSAYSPVTESQARGCTERGAVAGTDHMGVPCVYFTDPTQGLCRIGQRGIEDLALSVRSTWKRRNLGATIHPRLIYYPDLGQVWYSVALDSESFPSLLFFHETKYGANLFHDGLPATARSFALFPDTTTGILTPRFGTISTALPGGGTTYIHKADTGTTDTGTTFRAYVKTKPYMLGTLWEKFGMMAGVLLGRAEAGTTITIQMIRNFGVETKSVTASLSPATTESHVIRPIDNASFSSLNTVQLEYGDASASEQAWSVDQMVFRPRSEDSSA